MRKRFLDSVTLAHFEENVVHETKRAFGEQDWRLFFVVDELLQLQFHLNPAPGTAPPPEHLQSIHYTHYQQLPFSVRQAHALWRSGYYLESSLLIRSLWESFIQLPFFRQNPGLHAKHLAAVSTKDLAKFKVMFEARAAGSYDLVYAKHLCKFAHGAWTFAFRTKVGPSPGQVMSVHGVEFDAIFSELLHKHLVAVIRAFLTHVDILFPANKLQTVAPLGDDVSATLKWLTDYLNWSKANTKNPTIIDRLIALGTP